MNGKELKQILSDHALWLKDSNTGKRVKMTLYRFIKAKPLEEVP